MLTKNFNQLNDFTIFKNLNSQNEIMKKIENIEKNIIEDKNFFGIGNIARVIVEDILLNAFNCEGNGLKEKIFKLKSKIYIPTIVFGQLHIIRTIGNKESHSSSKKSDLIYQLPLEKEESIILLKAIWIILKFVLEEKRIDTKELNFDKNLYSKNDYFNVENLKIKELNNTNEDIKASLLSITQLVMLEYSFNIPTYQRDYNWNKEKNIRKLLIDLENRNKDSKTHYFGALAIAFNQKEKILRIIDGQQRITTSLILLKAFFDVYKNEKMRPKKELEEFMNRISKIYVNQKVLTSQKAVDSILNNLLSSSEASIKDSNAFRNYFHFKDWITKRISKIDELYFTFVSRFEIALLIFNTTINNEMDIFENLNTGGTELKTWDLIKNYIFSRLKPKIFLKKEKEINVFINREFAIPLCLPNSNKIAEKLSDFFTQYIRLEFILVNNKIWKNRYEHESFKEIWPKKSKYDSYELFIQDLKKIIKRFNIYLELTKGYKDNLSPLHIFSHILDFIMKKDIAPLLIYILEKNANFDEDNKIKKIKNQKFYEIIRAIEKYFIRIMVVSGFGNSQSLNFDKYLLFNLKKINKETFEKFTQNSFNPRMPSIDEFRDVLSTSGSLKRSAILNILINIEHSLKGLTIENSQQNPFEKTHEHILSKELDFKYDLNISNEEFLNQKDRWHNSLGNALVLTRGDNSKASNKIFLEKQQIYKNSSSLAKGNKEIMNLLTKKVFTYEDVEERSKQIANFIVKKLYK